MRFEKAKCSEGDLGEILSLYSFGPLVKYADVSGVPNTTFRISTSNWPFILRIYGKGQTSFEHMLLEHKLLEFLAVKGVNSPRLLVGANGCTLQSWRGYHLCAFAMVEGVTADALSITPEIATSVGRSVAKLRLALREFPVSFIPEAETIFARGQLAIGAMRRSLSEKSWELDVAVVEEHWMDAAKLLRTQCKGAQSLLHADTWPPNVICKDGQVAGIIDFDDCCYGPEIIDFAIPLQEFAVFQPEAEGHELARAFFSGLAQAGAKLSRGDLPLLIPAMRLMCSVWCAYNVIQSPKIEDALLYYRRLEKFSSESFVRSLRELIELALAP